MYLGATLAGSMVYAGSKCVAIETWVKLFTALIHGEGPHRFARKAVPWINFQFLGPVALTLAFLGPKCAKEISL